jgi:hypothetical protein
MYKSMLIVMSLLFLSGCTQESAKTPPEYSVIADQFLGVFLKHAELYLMNDLDGDNHMDVAVVDQRDDNSYVLTLYKRNGDKWILTNSISIENHAGGKPVTFQSYPQTNLVLPISIPDYNDLAALDVDGIPGKEILVPYAGTAFHAILVYKVSNNIIMKIGEFKSNIAELSGND